MPRGSRGGERERHRWFCSAVVLALLLAPVLGVCADPSAAQQLVAASDAIRNPQYSFGLITDLFEYRDGELRDSMSMKLYAKPDTKGGQFRNLIQFTAPARDANKLMLRNGNDIWLYDPSTKASIRISPQQRLLGQAANGDIFAVNLSLDYRATLEGEESITDGDRKERRCHKLKLKSQSRDTTYDNIEYWQEQGSNWPIKARFYSESGRLLKTAFFRRFEQQLDVVRPTETVIIDGLNPKWVTVMRVSNYVRRDVPETWLQRDYLPRFKPE